MRKINFIKKYVIVLLMAVCFFGCSAKNDLSNQIEKNTEASDQKAMTPAEVYTVIKDCDDWHYSFDGTVNAVKNGKRLTINGEKQICSMQYSDGWLYYVKANDNNSVDFDIIRISPADGTEFVIVNSKDLKDDVGGSFLDFLVTKTFVYIRKGYKFYRVNLSDGKIVQLADAVGSYVVHNDAVYFNLILDDEFTVCCADTKETEPKILLRNAEYAKHHKSGKIIIADDALFFVVKSDKNNLTDLCKYENNASSVIENDPIYEDSLFEHNGKLYYVIDEDEKKQLIEYDPRLEMRSAVLSFDGYYAGGKISGDYFCFLDRNKQLTAIKM